MPAINLLDADAFRCGEYIAATIASICKGHWEYWPVRAHIALTHAISILHNADSNPLLPREEQYTILDATRVLLDETVRSEVLSRVRDANLRDWWDRDFDQLTNRHYNGAIVPLANTLSSYFSSINVSVILGGQ
jgi:hypothetical protein